MSATTEHLLRTERSRQAELDLQASVYELVMERMRSLDEDLQHRVDPAEVLRTVAEEFEAEGTVL